MKSGAPLWGPMARGPVAANARARPGDMGRNCPTLRSCAGFRRAPRPRPIDDASPCHLFARKIFPRSQAIGPWPRPSADFARRQGSAFSVRQGENRLRWPGKLMPSTNIPRPGDAPCANVSKGIRSKRLGCPSVLPDAKLKDQLSICPRRGQRAGDALRRFRDGWHEILADRERDRVQSFGILFRDTIRA